MSQLVRQFVLGSGASSDIIALAGADHFSHVDIVVPVGHPYWPQGGLFGARSDSVGGQPPGLRLRPENYEPWKKRVRFTNDYTDEQEQGVWAFLYSQEGKHYDELGILGFITGEDWTTRGNWFCSAGQMAADVSVDYFVKPYMAPTKTAPAMYANLLSIKGATWEELPVLGSTP